MKTMTNWITMCALGRIVIVQRWSDMFNYIQGNIEIDFRLDWILSRYVVSLGVPDIMPSFSESEPSATGRYDCFSDDERKLHMVVMTSKPRKTKDEYKKLRAEGDQVRIGWGTILLQQTE